MPQSIPTLQELAFMYNTDKSSHGYMDFYEKHLPKEPKKILEIGVLHGNSIRMWQKYFPNCEVHGFDLFIENDVPSIPGVKWWKGNQTDQYVLEQLRRENFDCIIEDASHDCRKHWITLFGLIDSCGQYYIEDLHTCDDTFFSEGLIYEHTIKGAVKAGKIPFHCILSENENIVLIKP
jgi:hypothetical protein